MQVSEQINTKFSQSFVQFEIENFLSNRNIRVVRQYEVPHIIYVSHCVLFLAYVLLCRLIQYCYDGDLFGTTNCKILLRNVIQNLVESAGKPG